MSFKRFYTGFDSLYVQNGNRSFFLLIVIFLCAPSLPGEEEEVPEIEIKVIAEDLSSTVTTTEDVDLATTTSVYSVIDVSSKKGENSSIGEILQKEVGFQVKKAGTAGSFATVYLRGISSNQVMVYLDGILLNTGRSAYIDFSLVPVDIIESIEVFRGSTPSKFSDASFGGVINIKTKRKQGQSRFSCSLGMESFGVYRGSISGFESFSESDLIYSVSLSKSEGNYEFLNNNGTEFNNDDDSWDERINNDFREEAFDIKYRIYSGDETVITLSEMFISKERGIPGRENNQSEHTRYSNNESFFNISVDRVNAFGERNNLFFRIFWKQINDEFIDRYSEVGLGEQHVLSRIDEIGIRGVAELYHGPNFSSTFTAQVSGESFVPENKLEESFHTYIPFASSRDKTTLSYNVQYFRNKAVTSATLRYMAVNNNINADVLTNHVFDEVFTGQLGWKYLFSDRSTVKANYGTYYRVPTMGELFGDWGYFLGNPDLVPEYGINIELSFEYRKEGERESFLGFQRGEITVFRTGIHDYIQYLFNAQGVGRPDNLGKAEITGIELSSHHSNKKGFRFDHGLTVQRPLDRTYVDYNYGNILPGRSQVIYTAEVSYTHGNWYYFADLLLEYGTYYDGPNMRGSPDKRLLGAGIKRSFSKQWDAVFRADNILNERYEDYGGYPLPGTMYSLVVGWNY